MSFEKIKENTNDLKDHTVEYINNTIAYYKLWFFKVITKFTTLLLKIFMLGVLLAIALLFLLIAAALGIGCAFNSYAIGFLTVGVFCLIVFVVIYFIKDKLIEKPLLKTFSSFFFND